MRLQLNSLQQWILIGDVLCERNVEHRTRWAAQGKAGELCVPHNTHDAECAGVLRQIEAEVLPERILVLFEEAPHESFVDNRNGLHRFVIAPGEVPPADQAHTEVLKIVGAHAVPGSAPVHVQLGRWMAGHQNEFPPVVRQRIV